MNFLSKLVKIREQFEYLEAKLASGETENFGKLSREYAELKPVADIAIGYLKALEERDDVSMMLEDLDLREMANEELKRIDSMIKKSEIALRQALLPVDEADKRSAILEIRPGTGGDEAGLFASDLFNMYKRYAENKGWTFEVIEEQISDVGGIKEVTAHINGTNVFSKLKYESGVHRVQRVPTTESAGRVHTSAATVAVLPEAEEVDVNIASTDIRIDTMRASGAGGQHVNTTDSAVRITHIPTGIVVVSAEKSQHRNREIAMQVLRSRLYDLERKKIDDERSADRKTQVGGGDRSERIRTYNFPQGRISDHRINLTLYKLDQILAGDLDEFIDALTTDSQARMLLEQES
ncbi:MAG: peptide chain release factor 1 [Rhodospirillaceae bacterium]|nr:peptide chain release factor 1 [Rhodospirillaceae bacterium]